VLCSDFEAIDVASKPVTLNGETLYRGPFPIENMARGEIRILGATTAVSKDVFSSFPLLQPTVKHEDRVLPFRALLLGGKVELVNKKLVLYRVEGGISRGQVKTGRDYLRHQLPDLSERILPDAFQRLSDLMTMLPVDKALSKACKATMIDHQACIELGRARGFDIDLMALKWLRKGARPGALLTFYLKLKFILFFDFYYRKRFIK